MLATLMAYAAISSPVLAGYLPAWKTETYDFSRLAPLTDVLYFSAQPSKDGELLTTDLRLADLLKLAEEKKKLKFRTLLCIGGWERGDGFYPTATDAGKLSRFVREVDDFCELYSLDGVDLDWEHPKNADEANAYGVMITALGKALHPKKRIVTAAIASWQAMSKEAVDGLDRVHLMSYDHDQRHATFEMAKTDIANARKMGFPDAKIVLGVPFYGRSIKDRSESEYRTLFDTYHPKPADDEVGDIYFNGAATLAKKADLVKTSKLGGVMIWEVTQDVTGPTSLLNTLRSALKR